MMAAQPRPPVFELHIRPMFRLLEREHMTTLLTPGIDLWDLDAVWAKRNLILGRLRGLVWARLLLERSARLHTASRTRVPQPAGEPHASRGQRVLRQGRHDEGRHPRCGRHAGGCDPLSSANAQTGTS